MQPNEKTACEVTGNTAHSLAQIRGFNNRSALHDAARYGYLPPNTTPEELAACKDNNGHSALHEAAEHGRLPPTTTPQILANCKNDVGFSALHSTAFHGRLLATTTIKDLKTTVTKNGKSAWQSMLDFASLNPAEITKIPPHLLNHTPQLAIQMSQKAIAKQPNTTNTVAIWLGRIFAKNGNVSQTKTQPSPSHP